jgi:tRNA A22 N-methylase
MSQCEYCLMGRGIYDMARQCCIDRYEREMAQYDPIRKQVAKEARERLQRLDKQKQPPR